MSISTPRPANTSAYSAEVSLTLVVGDQNYPLAKVGPTRAVLRTPVDLPPCDAEILVEVDGRIDRHPVTLPNGCTTGDTVVQTIDR